MKFRVLLSEEALYKCDCLKGVTVRSGGAALLGIVSVSLAGNLTTTSGLSVCLRIDTLKLSVPYCSHAIFYVLNPKLNIF